MSEETTATETVEPKAKKVKAPAEPRPEESLYCTNVANTEGTVHAQIQRYVFDNPGATRSAIVKGLTGQIKTKEAPATDRYITSYVAGGIRRGYLTTEKSAAASEFPAKVAKAPKKSEKTSAGDLTKQGRALVDALEKVVTDAGAPRTTTVSVETLTTAMGNKPLSHAARTITKLEKDGYIVVYKDEADKMTGFSLTDKEAPAAKAAEAAPAE